MVTTTRSQVQHLKEPIINSEIFTCSSSSMEHGYADQLFKINDLVSIDIYEGQKRTLPNNKNHLLKYPTLHIIKRNDGLRQLYGIAIQTTRLYEGAEKDKYLRIIINFPKNIQNYKKSTITELIEHHGFERINVINKQRGIQQIRFCEQNLLNTISNILTDYFLTYQEQTEYIYNYILDSYINNQNTNQLIENALYLYNHPRTRETQTIDTQIQVLSLSESDNSEITESSTELSDITENNSIEYEEEQNYYTLYTEKIRENEYLEKELTYKNKQISIFKLIVVSQISFILSLTLKLLSANIEHNNVEENDQMCQLSITQLN